MLSYTLRYVSLTELVNVWQVGLWEPIHLCTCVSEEVRDGEGVALEVRSSYWFPLHSTFSNVTLNPLLRDLTLSILKETLTGGSPINPAFVHYSSIKRELNLVEGSDGSCFNIHFGLFEISHEPSINFRTDTFHFLFRSRHFWQTTVIITVLCTVFV
jgi:hypothetical protein